MLLDTFVVMNYCVLALSAVLLWSLNLEGS